MNYEQKYLKYKAKYLALKAELEGGKVERDKYGNLLVNLEDGIIFPTKHFIHLVKLRKPDNLGRPKYDFRITKDNGTAYEYIDIKDGSVKDDGMTLTLEVNKDSMPDSKKKEYGTYEFHKDEQPDKYSEDITHYIKKHTPLRKEGKKK